MNHTQKVKAIKTAAEIMLVACNVMEIFSEPDWRVIKLQSSYIPKEKLPYNDWQQYIFSEIKKLSVKPFDLPY